jgi:MoaA/NifB/PqqE/SkfB family radical SAM enzyme
VVFSGGEALLKSYTSELVAHGSSLGLFLEVLTHGYWDDQDRIEKLALARPGRVTVSLDGIGDTHTKIRGRDKFFEKTSRTIDTLRRIRAERKLDYTIRVKNVVMSYNLDEVCEVARLANQDGMEAFFQPIEQNYNTPEDSRWFEHSENWPQDTEHAIARDPSVS